MIIKPIKLSTKTIKLPVIKPLKDDDEKGSFILKPRKEAKKPEFYVSDQLGNFFCGYKYGLPYWNDRISDARELTEERHFQTLTRWEKGFRTLKKEYI